MGYADTCKHYRTLIHHDTCEKDHIYQDEKKPDVKPHILPCHKKDNFDVCPDREFPSQQDIDAREQRIQKSLEDGLKARKAIVADCGPYKKGKSPNAEGSINCPVCGAQAGLRYSRAAYNGHVWAQCVTPGCVNWIE